MTPTRKKKILKGLKITALVIFFTIVFLYILGGVVHASSGSLIDDTVNPQNLHSKYSLSNYHLDFYVDTSWSWLPWNWISGLGKQVMYGLYAITDIIWTISNYISSATGYVIKEAYSLDFIGKTANAIGKNIQTIAGVSENGISSTGFYFRFLLIFTLILGCYVTYVGMIKRETTKAVKALVNFVVVFLVSASIIAYAPSYITNVNDFSSDISKTALEVGAKIVMPDSDTRGQDSVDLIRDSLFAVQVRNPWLLLQYGTTDIESIGVERVEELVSTRGRARELIVIDEIENQDNENMSVSKVINRMGTVIFLFAFNIGISIFVFLLCGVMIFSQVLFIIFAMFLPIGFLLSMLPTYENMAKTAVVRLFNTIMTRAGITLIITVAFSISTMLYNLSTDTPFFMVMFLQIVTFAGIYFKLGDLMSMFSLQNDSQGMGGRIMRRPRMFMHRHTRRLNRSLRKALPNKQTNDSSLPMPSKPKNGNKNTTRDNTTQQSNTGQTAKKPPLSHRMGQTVANVADTPAKVVATAGNIKDKVKNAPLNAKYAVHDTKKKVGERANKSLNNFKTAKDNTREQAKQQRQTKRDEQRQNIARKRDELAVASMKKHNHDFEVGDKQTRKSHIAHTSNNPRGNKR